MTKFAVTVLAAAIAVAGPDARAATPSQPAADAPADAGGQGGPYEPVALEATVVVDGRRGTDASWTVAPDRRLERRYAPRGRTPLNRLTIRF